MKHNRIAKSRGFTLLEIMVVVVILGILATFVVPNIMDKPAEARIAKARSDIGALELALDSYKLDNFRYPTTDQGLEALVRRPNTEPAPRNWREGGYVKALQKDPWGNDYRYLSPGARGAIDVYSLGPDGVSSDDDVGNWVAQ
jgi:general secretion pathway protein G